MCRVSSWRKPLELTPNTFSDYYYDQTLPKTCYFGANRIRFWSRHQERLNYFFYPVWKFGAKFECPNAFITTFTLIKPVSYRSCIVQFKFSIEFQRQTADLSSNFSAAFLKAPLRSSLCFTPAAAIERDAVPLDIWKCYLRPRKNVGKICLRVRERLVNDERDDVPIARF